MGVGRRREKLAQHSKLSKENERDEETTKRGKGDSTALLGAAQRGKEVRTSQRSDFEETMRGFVVQ